MTSFVDTYTYVLLNPVAICLKMCFHYELCPLNDAFLCETFRPY